MENMDKNNAMFSSNIDDSQYFEDRTLHLSAIPELSVESIKVKKIGRGRKREILQKNTFDVIPPAVKYVPDTELYDDSAPYEDFNDYQASDDYAQLRSPRQTYAAKSVFDEYTYEDDEVEDEDEDDEVEDEDEYSYEENALSETDYPHADYEDYAPQDYYEPNMEENSTPVKISATSTNIINPDMSSVEHITSEIAAIDSQVETRDEILTASVSINQIGMKSVAKVSAAVGSAVGVIWVLFLGILYFLLDVLGVWEKFNSSFSGSSSVSGSLLSTWTVLLFTIISGLLLFMAIVCFSLFMGVIYNLCAETFGGIRVELKDAPGEQKINQVNKE